MLCSPPRARPRRRRTPASWSSRPTPPRARRWPRPSASRRRALRPRGQPEPARRHVGRRRRPRPGRPLQRAVHAARRPRSTTTRRRRPPTLASRRDRRPRPVRPVRAPGCCAASRSDRRRRGCANRLTLLGHAADQQRGRRLELRDARAGPAQPPLRPGPAAGRRPAGAPGPRRRDARDPRRRRAHVHRRRPADLRRRRHADRHRRDHGRRVDRDLRRRPPTCCSRWRGSSRWRSPSTSRRLGLRSEASARFEKGCDPEVIDRGRGPLLPSCSAEICGADRWRRARRRARRRCPTGRPVRVRTARVNAHPRHRPDGGPRSAASSSRSGSRRRPWTAATTTSPIPPLALRLRDRDRRHRGGRPPLRLRPHRRSVLTVRPHPAGLTARQHDRRGVRARARRPRAGRGACPCRSSRRATSSAAGSTGDGIAITNPLVAEESVLRTSLLPGLLKAVAYNASHRNPGVGALRDRPRVPPAARRSSRCPTSASTSASRSPGGRRRRRSRCGWSWPTALAVPDARLEADEVPGLHPTRTARASVGGDDRRARSARSTPPCSSATASTSGWPGSSSTSTRCSATPHGERPYRPVSRYPSSDIDLAFEVDDDVAAGAVERGAADCGRAACWPGCELFDVYRGAQVADGRRSLAYRCGSRPPTARSPTTRSPRCGARASTPSRPRSPLASGGSVASPQRSDHLSRNLLARTRDSNPLPEGTFAVGVGLLVAGVTACGFLVVSARALGKTEYAPLSVLWSLVFLAGPGFFLPLEQEVSRALAARRARGEGLGTAAAAGRRCWAVGSPPCSVVVAVIASPALPTTSSTASVLLVAVPRRAPRLLRRAPVAEARSPGSAGSGRTPCSSAWRARPVFWPR